MKITKSQLKEMIRKSIRPMLNEAFDRGDLEWQQSVEEDDVFKMLKQAEMPMITRQKMSQVVAALEKRADIRRSLSKPENKKKIQGALASGQFDALANALERIVIKAPRPN